MPNIVTRVIATASVAAVSLVGITALEANPVAPVTAGTAEARPYNCYTNYGGSGGSYPYAYSQCNNGSGQHRVVSVWRSPWGWTTTRRGPWKNAGSRSWAYGPSGYSLLYLYVQTR